MLIPLAEYARGRGKDPANARQLVARGAFASAQKIGRDWFVDDAELWPDRRVKSGNYIGQRAKRGEMPQEGGENEKEPAP